MTSLVQAASAVCSAAAKLVVSATALIAVIAASDDLELDLLWADRFAFTDVGAIGKAFHVHQLNQRQCTAVAFHLSNAYAKTGTTSRHELVQLVRVA